MREILYRGKNKFNNREWVDGFLLRGTFYYDDSEMFAIVPIDNTFYPRGEISSWEEVIPETVGQFTGLFDKNGIAIFEGDIVKLDESVKEIFNVKDGPIEYIGGCFLVGGNDGNILASLHTLSDIDWALRGSVIGNIHDNPELLEGDNINETNI